MAEVWQLLSAVLSSSDELVELSVQHHKYCPLLVLMLFDYCHYFNNCQMLLRRLCISMLRQLQFGSPGESLFGMFDGGMHAEVPLFIANNIADVLRLEVSRHQIPAQTMSAFVHQIPAKYMKYALLSMHRFVIWSAVAVAPCYLAFSNCFLNIHFINCSLQPSLTFVICCWMLHCQADLLDIHLAITSFWLIVSHSA